MTVPALPSPTRIDVDGVEIATYRLDPDGQSSASNVVICHGTPWSAAMRVPVARILSDQHRVFLWDMPGYGKSISDDNPAVDLVQQRKRLAAVIDHWQLDRPNVVAHDIGGAVALGAHLLEGCAFASLYLVDIVTLDPWGSPFFRLVTEHEEAFAALPPELHTALIREYIAGAAGRSLDSAWVDELARPWRTPAGQRAFYRQIAQLSPRETRPIVDRLADVRCPTQIGWGDSDPWIPIDQAYELAAAIPAPVDVVRFSATGHLVPVEATDALGMDLLRWLEGASRR
ncbi:alpha/beta fold hydrolase [Pseudactinotalea sp. HY160]|uniref:alpha/beta fold hydrolase n=1 Tax=Pseudactinotalea sp. HY160 TaxID=2654490 RepID=UPI0013110BE6|nr:alpha/beta fold hydrolase [Pseudactinotalea sp. HY160]